MHWTLDKVRPLCPQISGQLCLRVALGEFPPGSRLLSVREAALEAGVNPNTVQRAFEALEQQGILYSQRGSGWYVAEDITPAKEALERLRREKTADYFEAMSLLGMDTAATQSYVEEWNA